MTASTLGQIPNLLRQRWWRWGRSQTCWSSFAISTRETVAHFDQLNGLYKTLTGSAVKTEQLPPPWVASSVVRCALLRAQRHLSHQWKALVDNIGKGDVSAYIKTEIPADKEFRGVGFEGAAVCSPTG